MSRQPDSRPNIVIILADDMGFSDIGAYGSEIRTPNLDQMATSGLVFTQMYNYARCCPSRAALLTGLSPHRAGIGHMVANLDVPGYEGYLNRNCVTLIEGRAWGHDKPLLWEHEGNCAVRLGEWKLVKRFPEKWELYDMSQDQTELNDLAPFNRPRVERVVEMYREWAARTRIAPWPVTRLGPNVFWGGGYGMRPWLSKGPPSL